MLVIVWNTRFSDIFFTSFLYRHPFNCMILGHTKCHLSSRGGPPSELPCCLKTAQSSLRARNKRKSEREGTECIECCKRLKEEMVWEEKNGVKRPINDHKVIFVAKIKSFEKLRRKKKTKTEFKKRVKYKRNYSDK